MTTVTPPDDMTSNDDEQRTAFLDAWHQTEKRLVRAFGAALIVTSLLPFVLESQGDQLSALLTAVMLGGGFWFIMRSTRARPQRIHLSLLSLSQQNQRSVMAAIGAALMVMFGTMNDRPLFFLVAVLLLPVAGWYRWRVNQLEQYDAMLNPQDADDDNTPTEDAE